MGVNMKKALIAANTASMIKLFNRANIEILQSMGYEIHMACNFLYGNTVSSDAVERATEEWKKQGIFVHQVDFLRSPFSWKSFDIYKQIKRLLDEEKFDLIHCHTPIVAAFTRLAAAKARCCGDTKLIYTAHGFHFYKGCPLSHWLLYYPMEKILARMTDVLITINSEDYTRAITQLPCPCIEHVNGIGIDTQMIKTTSFDRTALCDSLGISEDSKIIISAGELNANKNHRIVIQALAKLKSSNVHYLIAGIGADKEKLAQQAESYGCSERVHFLGYRNDIVSLLKCSNMFLFPSFREGLSVVLMEAMAAGVPVVASRIRGNVDLIEDGYNGFLCDPEDAEDFANKIQQILDDPALAERFCNNSLEKIKEYDKSVVVQRLREIYCNVGSFSDTAMESS